MLEPLGDLWRLRRMLLSLFGVYSQVASSKDEFDSISGGSIFITRTLLFLVIVRSCRV